MRTMRHDERRWHVIVNTGDLQEGMVLNRDLEHGGLILLREGAILTEHLIQTIVGRQVKEVDIMADSAPGLEHATYHSVKSFALSDNETFMAAKQAVETLFSAVPEKDAQLALLKYCILSQLEEAHHD